LFSTALFRRIQWPTLRTYHETPTQDFVRCSENVIAGTDCGLGGRVRADLVWAKLCTLVEGARFGSQSLWPS